MKAQQGPFYSIDLYKMDASYSLFAHNGSEASIGTRFPGVSSTDVTPTDSASLSFDYQIRAQKMSGNTSVYFESDLNYGNKAQRQAGGAYTRSQTANFSYQEIGLAVGFRPAHQNPSGWKFLFPASMQSQVIDPRISVPFPSVTPSLAKVLPPCPAGSIDVSGSCAQTTPQTVIAPHSYYVAARPGVRFDYLFPKPGTGSAGSQGGGKGQSGNGGTSSGGGAKGGSLQVAPQNYNSYLEVGYEGGPQLNGTKAFESQAGGLAAPVSQCGVFGDISACILNQISSLKGMFPASQTPPIVVSAIPGRTHYQDGFYANFRIDMPLPFATRYEFVVENRGDFFLIPHGHDSPVDTRFFDDLRSSFIVPLYGHLSLAPSFEILLFENKINDSLYRSTNSFVSLSYSFDWRTGLEWRQLLRFNNPVPPLTSLPNR